MKDIVITGQRIKRELLVFAGCILAAICVNIYSIIKFGTQWKELFTTWYVTLPVAVAIFVVLALARLLAHGCVRVFRRKSA